MKFLIVDDHAVVREGVASVLRQAAADPVILQARDTPSALAATDANDDLDLVIVDLMLPGAGGMGLLEDLGKLHPGTPVIVLSSSESIADVRRALRLGALGYVPKSADPATLLAALKMVLGGEIYVPPFVMLEDAAFGTEGANAASDSLVELTERQAEVLGLIGEDVANKEIAYRLGISEKTVKAHVTAIFRHLNVVNRAQAARLAKSAPNRPSSPMGHE